jgi:TRAP-type C4-dicarboxylate transport system permease small subunit
MTGFDDFFGRILDFLAYLVCLMFGIGTSLIALDVALRNLAGIGFPWLIDAIEYGLLAGTFLAAPWVLREGAHVRVDVVVSALPPRGAALLETIADLIGLAVCLILLWYGVKVTLTAEALGSMVLKSIIFPEWWALAVVPLSSLLLAIEFVMRLCRAHGAAAATAQGH